MLQEATDASCSKALQTFLEFIAKYRLNQAKWAQTPGTWTERWAAMSKQAAGAQLSTLERSQTSVRTVLKVDSESAQEEDWQLQNKGHPSASVSCCRWHRPGALWAQTQRRPKCAISSLGHCVCSAKSHILIIFITDRNTPGVSLEVPGLLESPLSLTLIDSKNQSEQNLRPVSHRNSFLNYKSTW